MNNKYVPSPLDTTGVEIPESLTELTEALAENVHENWAASRVAQGWTYGKERNDREKTTPCLLPYGELPEEEKEYDRVTAMETLRFILAKGYKIVKD